MSWLLAVRLGPTRTGWLGRVSSWILGGCWAGAMLGASAFGASLSGGKEGGDGAASGDPVRFNRDIRPVLSDHCFACHGFDPKKRKAGLRLDVADGALGVGKSGRVAIKPGDPEGSEVWRRLVTTDADDLMPPREAHKPLGEAQRALIRRWIRQGAPYEKHWAFEPPVAVEPPTTPDQPRANPIDRFIVDRLVREGMGPSPEADRSTLIRRLTLDLAGLPPTPEEVAAFAADAAPGAYERLVERLLGSPRFGEHWASHWLDVARYADTHGLHLDNERQMWPYRDWVVRAFNRNLPFDEFTVEQIAGDLLPDATQEQLVATGFNRNNVTSGEGGSIDAELLFRYAVERTSTTLQAWMGLTAGCAVCHDHKYDPISSKEFYSLYAFFNNAADPAMDGNVLLTPPVLKLKQPEDERRLADWADRIAQAEARVTAAAEKVDYVDPASMTPPPAPKDFETVWVDDDVPAGWKVASNTARATEFVGAGTGPVASGQRALRRRDEGLGQDVFETGSEGFEVPPGGRLFVSVRLDPGHLPRAIMVQYRTGEWRHRAVWGDEDVIDWGAKGTTERAFQGPLPRSGVWVRLEVEAAKVGLKPGDKVNGFAVTQHGGTVHWDRIGVAGRSDPANDPTRSLAVWLKRNQGKEDKSLPEAVRGVLKDVPPEGRTPEQERRLREHFLVRICADTRPVFDPLLGAVAALEKQRDEYESAIPSTFIWRDQEKPRDSFEMERGAYDRPGTKVLPGVPAAFPPLATTRPPTRLDLARWMVSEANPLTARVAVNRFWQQLFGVGLVKTAEDFGSQGQPPSHPELLDWLAVRFRGTGWDVKGLIRLIVTSATYRQSAKVTADPLQRDPDNRWLAHGPRVRLSAEQIRDNALFVSGLLVGDIGGKGVRTYQPPNIWEPVGFVGSNTREYRQDGGAALYRRSLYTFFKRTAPAPFLSTFDAPNREQICTRRERSNTPLQALLLMNDVQQFEAARALAERMLREGGATASARLEFGCRVVLARAPGAAEVEVLERALAAHRARYATDPASSHAVVTAGESRPAPSVSEPELAAYTMAANLLLNLDETLTRN